MVKFQNLRIFSSGKTTICTISYFLIFINILKCLLSYSVYIRNMFFLIFRIPHLPHILIMILTLFFRITIWHGYHIINKVYDTVNHINKKPALFRAPVFLFPCCGAANCTRASRLCLPLRLSPHQHRLRGLDYTFFPKTPSHLREACHLVSTPSEITLGLARYCHSSQNRKDEVSPNLTSYQYRLLDSEP